MRVATFPLVTWKPFEKQVPWLECNARHKWAVCGNRTGKTESGLMEDVADCLGIDVITKARTRRFTPPIEVWIVSETEEASIEIVQRKMGQEILGADQSSFGWELVRDNCHYSEKGGFSNNHVQFTNGSRIDFKYSSQGATKFQGTKKHKIHLDEEQPLDVYKECYARTIDYEGRITGTMTPIFDKNHGLPWVHKELYLQRKQRRIEFFNWSLYDNPHLSDAAKQALIDEWDEDEIDARVYGYFVPMGIDLAFKRPLINKMRETSESGRTGHMEWDNQGRAVFVEENQAA